MGKFNVGGIVFDRTIQDVVEDYARFLLQQKFITEDEFFFHINDENDKREILDALFEKLYETEEYNGVTISTLDSFFHFCTFIIKEYKQKPVWNQFVRDMFLSVERNRDTAIMASRSLGKSFFLYALYPIFKMFLYRQVKILAVSNIPLQCVENLRITRDLININEVLYQKKEVNLGKELKWTERQLQYNGGMFVTLSAGTSPRGLHVNYTIVDDMITEGCQLNDEEAENYLVGQLYPTVQRQQGRVIVSGTPQHRKDLYHLIMGDLPDCAGNPISDGRISYKKFYSIMFPIMNAETEEPSYPEIYAKPEIARIREKLEEYKFQREYMLNCIDASLTIFAPHLLKSISDPTLAYEYSAGGDASRQFIISVDVATSGQASADFSAFVVLEVISTPKGKKKVVRFIVHEKGMEISKQIETIIQLAKRFNNARVVVEKNNVGVALIQELRRSNTNVEEFVTTKPKKEGMIRYLVNEMKNKNLWLPEDTTEIKKLKQELLNFGVRVTRSGVERMEALTGHDDMVMSLAIANEAAQDLGGLPYAITINRR